ncbi:restriction endonuclease subunit S [Pseudomonas sp. XP1]
MSSEWRAAKIEEIAAPYSTALATGPFGSAISSKYFVDSGVPVIRGSNLSADTSTRLIDADLVFVSHEKANEFQRSVAKRGDLVFTCWGTINQVGLIDSRSKFDSYIVSNKQMKLTIDPAKADHRFIYYVFSGPAKQNEILENGIGSSVPGFNLGQLKRHEILLPPVQEQVRIADFLETFDDRITLLRETNATLEGIAQALFKSWFVGFDPVRAKAEGRQPDGMDAATAALFPDSFEESELGLVPKGWRVFRVEDLMELAYGKALKATDRVDGQVPVYGSGGITGYHDQSLLDGPGIIVGRKGTVGSLYWEDCPFFPIDTVFYVKAKKPLTYCYYLLRTLGLEGMNTDGAVPGLNRGNAYRLRAVVPPEAVLEGFDGVASRLRGRIFANAQQAQTLTQLRDILLPRLISGQLRLPEAEALIEEAV